MTEKNESTILYRKWLLAFLILIVAGLLFFAVFTIVIDPYFHYHAPLKGVSYPLEQTDERYINDGILKNYDYDAVIIGTSMTECFSASLCDELFGAKTVKVPLSGGSYKETYKEVATALSHNDNVRIVIRAFDGIRYFDDKDACDYPESSYPTYLYDDNPLNDAEYLLNKSILVGDLWDVIGMTRTGKKGTTFDEYANWNDWYVFGTEGVKNYYQRNLVERVDTQRSITDEEYATITANVKQNILALVAENPEVDFYYFFTPYSIWYWDYVSLTGDRERQIDAEEYMAGLMLQYDNLHVFSFYGQYDFVCNMDNYKDTHHYGSAGSDQILRWISEGTGELKADTYKEYYDEIRDFYRNYDYDALFML